MRNNFIIFFLIFTVFLPKKLHPQNLNDLNFALVYPELTKEVLYKFDNSFTPTDAWELYFMSNHFKYEMFNDNSLDEINNDVNIVVIPSLEVTTESMIEKIEDLLKDGKGVLITGNFAEYDDKGNMFSPEYRKRILEFNESRIPEINEFSINHTLSGNTPFSIDLKPGLKILLKNKPNLFCASGISDECAAAGNYFPVNEKFPDTLSGIISVNKSSGRILWLGFNFDQLIGNNRDKFLANSINWLSSRPDVFINNLPGKYSSAGIIYKIVERMGDIYFDDSLFKSEEINYFVSPDVFNNYGKGMKDFRDIGNINLIWDDFYFSNLGEGIKEDWLKKARSSFEDITGQNYNGILSFGGIYDSSAYSYLSNSGYSFEFSSGYSNSFSIENDTVNNFYSFINSSIPAANYKSRIKFIADNDGIIYINIDSLSLQNTLNNYLNNGDTWFTTFSDLLSWELKKKQLNITTDFIDNNYKIIIENNGLSDIRDVGIWLPVPGRKGNLYIKDSDESVNLIFDNDKKMFFLNVNLIRSNQKIMFTISGME